MTWSRLAAPHRFLLAGTLILMLAALLRLVVLHDVPPGLAQDEVLDADIAGFILEGRHALFFREGYGHEPLYHYWAAPFRVLLGDNVLSVRLPAVFAGLLLVAGTMRWARRDFGALAAGVAGSGLAISWWPIVFSRIGLRPILEPLLLVAALWFWPRRPWLAGIFLGAALYTYTAARYIFVLPLLFAGYLLLVHPKQHRGWGRLQHALVVFGVALACYVPLALTLRSDPTLQQRVEQLSGPLDALRGGDLGPIVDMTSATLGVFSFTGDPRWTYTIPDRPLFDPLTAVLFYAGLLLAIGRWRKPRYALLLLALLITLVPSAVTPEAPSTVRLIGAMPFVYVLPGLALAWLWQTRGNVLPSQGRFAATALLLFATLIFGLNLWRTVQDGFREWPQAVDTRLKYQTLLLEIARHWKEQEDQNALVVADAYFEPIDADSLRRNRGGSLPARWIQTGPDVAGAIVWPGQQSILYVPEYAPLVASLMAAGNITATPVYESGRSPRFAAYVLAASAPRPGRPLSASFEGKIALLGAAATLADPGELDLFTYWQVLSALPDDLAIFVHVLDGDGAVVAQHDGLDAAPSLLQPGDVVVQRHPLPARLAAEGTVQLGLYRRSTGARLIGDGIQADIYVLPADLFERP